MTEREFALKAAQIEETGSANWLSRSREMYIPAPATRYRDPTSERGGYDSGSRHWFK